MRVLVISNMGAKKKAPLQGLFVDNQVKRLKEVLPEVDYVKLTWNGDGIHHKLFKYPFFLLKFVLDYVFKYHKFDIIHVHYYYPTIFCAIVYKFFRNPKVKIIVTCHGGDIYCFQPPALLYKVFSYSVDLWIFTSDKLKKSFYRSVMRSKTLCAGYDEKTFLLNSIGSPKEIDCLFVGSCDRNKGVDRLIKLVKCMPKVTFAIVGVGDMAAELAACARKCSNLRVLGSKSPKQLATLMANTKFLLSLSRNESFGLVIAEAHSCGTPCIVTETDGSIEQLPHWPYMVPQKNIEEAQIITMLKKTIEQALVLSSSEYQTLQLNVIKQSKKYSLENVTKSLCAIYEEVINQNVASKRLY